MKKRTKDLAYAIKFKLDLLDSVAKQLDQDASKLYSSWNEPKLDVYKKQKIKDGKPQFREINAPKKSLKKIQKALLHNVLYKLEIPNYFYGGIQGKDPAKNARYHKGNKFFFLTDMKDFYPSINTKNVEKALRSHGFYPDVARLITRLCTTKGAVPQGCPTSSMLASIVISNIADDIFTKYLDRGFKVSVYVDDITISSPKDFKYEIQDLITELRSRSIKINFDKTEYRTTPPIITGIEVHNNKITVPKYILSLRTDKRLSPNSRNGYANYIDYVDKISESKI